MEDLHFKKKIHTNYDCRKEGERDGAESAYLFEKASRPRNECMRKARNRRHKRCEWGTHVLVGSILTRRHVKTWRENISDSVAFTPNCMHPMSFFLVSNVFLIRIFNTPKKRYPVEFAKSLIRRYENSIVHSLNPRKIVERTMPNSARRAHLI